MGILSSSEIKRRLALDIDKPECLVITPRLDQKFDHDGIDLKLGCYFRLPAISSIECIRPYRESHPKGGVRHYPELIHKPYGLRQNKTLGGASDEYQPSENDETLILQPQHAVLASTLEYIRMPSDVSAEILTKSSWARLFISIASAPWIHPLYRGCLTLEITNLGNVPVALPVGKPIAQLVFMKLEGEIEAVEDIIEGSYAGAVMPEAPMFK